VQSSNSDIVQERQRDFFPRVDEDELMKFKRWATSEEAAEKLIAVEKLIAAEKLNKHRESDSSSSPFRPLHMEFDPATEVQPVEPNRFKAVRQFADAERNRGKVHLMWDTVESKYVIAKVMPNWWVGSCHADFIKNHPDEIEFPWNDIGCMKFLNHRKVPLGVVLLGVYRDERNTEVVSSFATEGDLFMWCSHPERPPAGAEREEIMRPLITQLLRGVRQLHDLNIVHRDISLENILVTKTDRQDDWRLLIIDFGMSDRQRFYEGQPRGKRSYQAPEAHEPGEHDGFLIDAFAVGVVVYCILVNDYPWLSTRPVVDKCFAYAKACGFRSYVQKRTLRNTDIPVASILSEPALRLLEGLLNLDTEQRLTLGEEAWKSDGVSSRKSVWDEDWFQRP